MRQYAGNWAAAIRALAPGAEAKLDERIVKPAPMQKTQLSGIYGPNEAEIILQQPLARDAQPGPRPQLGDDESPGRRHLHDHRMVEAVQNAAALPPAS